MTLLLPTPLLLPDSCYLTHLQLTTLTMKFSKVLNRLRGAWEERLNLVIWVDVVDGLETIPYEQHSSELAVYSLECQYDGARDIMEWLEEDSNEVVMTDVLLPKFSEVDGGEISDKLETDQDHIQLWEESTSVSVTDVVEVTREEEEEELIRVSQNIETCAIDTTDCFISWTTKAEEGLNMGEVEQWVEEHNLEEKMHGAYEVAECVAADILVKSEQVQSVKQSADCVEYDEDTARVRVGYVDAEYVVDAEQG